MMGSTKKIINDLNPRFLKKELEGFFIFRQCRFITMLETTADCSGEQAVQNKDSLLTTTYRGGGGSEKKGQVNVMKAITNHKQVTNKSKKEVRKMRITKTSSILFLMFFVVGVLDLTPAMAAPATMTQFDDGSSVMYQSASRTLTHDDGTTSEEVKILVVVHIPGYAPLVLNTNGYKSEAGAVDIFVSQTTAWSSANAADRCTGIITALAAVTLPPLLAVVLRLGC